MINAIFKRIFDIAFSLISIILFAPLFITVALLIKMSSRGPILYKQLRIGLNGKQFALYKFRTMVFDVDADKHNIFIKELVNGDLGSERGSPNLKLGKDPRMTKVGRFLRRYSFDELPQLINILKGDMSLVGPRPATHSDVKYYEDWQKERLKCKPGFMSLSYVSEVSDFDKWMKMDIEYVRKNSIFLDIKIILKSISLIFSRGGGF